MNVPRGNERSLVMALCSYYKLVTKDNVDSLSDSFCQVRSLGTDCFTKRKDQSSGYYTHETK